MAEGYRISESGDFRVTESGDSRITENFIVGEASVSASSSISTVFSYSAQALSSLSGIGSTTSVANFTTTGASSLGATGSKATAGIQILYGYSILSGTSSTSEIGNVIQLADPIALNATGTLAPTGLKTLYGDSALAGQGSKLSAGIKVFFGQFTSLDLDFTRITEDGNTRVTEDGLDTRTLTRTFSNSVESTLISSSNKITFSSQPYYKDSTWKTFIPYVKYNGIWTGNIKIYKHTNGAWKRSY